MYKMYCDFCKKEISDRDYWSIVHDNYNGSEEQFYAHHVCNGCYSIIDDVMSKLRAE